VTTAHVVAAAARTCQDRAQAWNLGETLVLAVADGAGGTSGGGTAAEAVISAVETAIAAATALDCAAILGAIDSQLAKSQAGLSTGVIVSVTHGKVTGASAGDSAAWLVRAAGHEDLTRGEAQKPLLGSGRCRPVTFSAALDGTLLLATDGLFKYARPELIAALARGPDLAAASKSLVELVRLPSGKLSDDVAAILHRP
jgi:PPM family protein phosphatase